MIFATYEKVLDGTQTQTRRPIKSGKKKVGSVLGVQAHRTQQAIGYIKVTSVKEQLLGTVTEGEAKAEGHSDFEVFREAWRRRYGILDPAEDVWHIEFELISKDELTPYKVRRIEHGRTSSRLRAAARRQCKEPG